MKQVRPALFSLGWATSSREAEFEEDLEGAMLTSLRALSRELGEKQNGLDGSMERHEASSSDG